MKSKAHVATRELGGPSDRPLVVVNMAMTADGKIATVNRAVASFGSPRDLAHLYAQRATAEAVMCGARTAEMDGLQLGPGPARCRRLRRQRGLAEYNLRVLVSGSGSINPQATIFTRRFSPILILTTERAGERRLAALRKVADEVLVFGEKSVEPKLVNCAPKPREILISPVAQPSSAASSGGVPPLAPPPGGTPTPRGLRKDGRDERARCMNSQVDFAAALAELRTRWGVRRLVCEGGGELNAALFAAGLVDELHLTICPFVFGGRDAPSIADGVGVTRLAEAVRLELRSCRRHGDELFCVFAAAGAPAVAERSDSHPGEVGMTKWE